jgi:type VI protein secretion system component Hcp
MAVDMFINIGDLKREAQDKKPQDEIDVVSWSWEYQVAARRILAAEPAPKIVLSEYPTQH